MDNEQRAYQTGMLDQGRAAIDHSLDEMTEAAALLLAAGHDANDVLLSLHEVTSSDPVMSCWVAAGAILRMARGQT